MGKKLTRRFLKALHLVPLTDIAEGTGRGYSTLQAYKYGQRRVTAAAARDLARYLREMADEFSRIADQLEEAADQEEAHG
jgi:hypothetical protein